MKYKIKTTVCGTKCNNTHKFINTKHLVIFLNNLTNMGYCIRGFERLE